MANFFGVGTPVVMSATGVVSKIGCRLVGMLCSASSSGLVTLNDSATGATGTTAITGFPVVAGGYTPLPIAFADGIYLTLGGTGTVTFLVN